MRGVRAVAELLAPRLLPGAEREHARAVFIERWAENDPECYLASLLSLVGWSVRERLEAVRCPCAFVTGDRDYTPVTLKPRYVSELSNGELIVIPDSGHMTTHDQAEVLTRTIADLVSPWNAVPLSAPVTICRRA